MAVKVEKGNNPELNAEFQKSLKQIAKKAEREADAQKQSGQFQNMVGSSGPASATGDQSAAKATPSDAKETAGQDSISALFSKEYGLMAKQILSENMNQQSELHDEQEEEDND